jgi:hypothetical protein
MKPLESRMNETKGRGSDALLKNRERDLIAYIECSVT